MCNIFSFFRCNGAFLYNVIVAAEVLIEAVLLVFCIEQANLRFCEIWSFLTPRKIETVTLKISL